MTKAYVYDIYLTASGSDNYLTNVALESGFIDSGSFADVAAMDEYEYDVDPTGNITLIPEWGTGIIKFKYKGKY